MFSFHPSSSVLFVSLPAVTITLICLTRCLIWQITPCQSFFYLCTCSCSLSHSSPLYFSTFLHFFPGLRLSQLVDRCLNWSKMSYHVVLEKAEVDSVRQRGTFLLKWSLILLNFFPSWMIHGLIERWVNSKHLLEASSGFSLIQILSFASGTCILIKTLSMYFHPVEDERSFGWDFSWIFKETLVPREQKKRRSFAFNLVLVNLHLMSSEFWFFFLSKLNPKPSVVQLLQESSVSCQTVPSLSIIFQLF